jgi:hypothetical protein
VTLASVNQRIELACRALRVGSSVNVRGAVRSRVLLASQQPLIVLVSDRVQTDSIGSIDSIDSIDAVDFADCVNSIGFCARAVSAAGRITHGCCSCETFTAKVAD